MKQIILKSEAVNLPAFCLGRVAALWGAFGLAMAMLAQMTGPSFTGQAAVWATGLAAGLFIAAREL
jgi:hypothetical protein